MYLYYTNYIINGNGTYVFSNMINACFISQTVALARKYYGCDDIQGVYLENEGGSGTVRLDKILLFTDLIVSCI